MKMRKATSPLTVFRKKIKVGLNLSRIRVSLPPNSHVGQLSLDVPPGVGAVMSAIAYRLPIRNWVEPSLASSRNGNEFPRNGSRRGRVLLSVDSM